jgi:acetyltransferase-like isoleucine patch superfamily enzyme
MNFIKRKPQYYIFKILEYVQIYLWHVISFIKFKYWGVKMAPGVRLFGKFKIVNMNLITIGKNTRINSGLRNFVGSYNKVSLWAGQNGKIEIGENVGISNATIISENQIFIGSKVYIGGGTQIYDNDFHPLTSKGRDSNPNEIPNEPIHIGEGVFIGGHCIILKGVKIGENSIIGAGSLVTGNVPANEIWAGVPAKKIRSIV